MHAYASEFGWPGAARLTEGSVTEQPPELLPNALFEASEGINLWGYERAARNIDEDKIDNLQRHKLVEAGLYNTIDWLDKDLAESGELLLLIEGVPADPASTQRRRLPVFVSGVTYNPKVPQQNNIFNEQQENQSSDQQIN